MHMAGISEDGMVIVDVWESQEKLDAFFTTGGLGQALEESDMQVGQPSIHKLHDMIPQGSGSGDNVLVMIETEMTTDDYDEVAGALPAHAERRRRTSGRCAHRGRDRRREALRVRPLGVGRGLRRVRRQPARTARGEDGRGHAEVRAGAQRDPRQRQVA